MNPVMAVYINPWLLAAAIVIVIAILIMVVILVVHAHERKIGAGQEELVGQKAVVRVALNPRGMVFIEDELWNAEIESGTAEPEQEVTITRVQGLKLFVRK